MISPFIIKFTHILWFTYPIAYNYLACQFCYSALFYDFFHVHTLTWYVRIVPITIPFLRVFAVAQWCTGQWPPGIHPCAVIPKNGKPVSNKGKLHPKQKLSMFYALPVSPKFWSLPRGGGGVLLPKSYVDVPAEPRKSDFLYTNLRPITHPLVYHF